MLLLQIMWVGVAHAHHAQPVPAERTECLMQVCQESAADGSVQAVELYVQLSPSFSLGDLTVLVGRHHVEITEQARLASC